MAPVSRDFQIFAKPGGSLCNLECRYCYYLKKEDLYGKGEVFRMSDILLEEYIVQHIEASPGPIIRFSWHGGEPTILGLEYFQKIVALQRANLRPGTQIMNGIQTNGTLLDEKWCRFLSEEGFSVGFSLDGPPSMHDRYRLDRRQEPTHERAMAGYRLLRRYGVPCDILCVIHDQNVRHPIEVYRFFRDMGARYIGFLPLVEHGAHEPGVSDRTVPAKAFGDFLCAIFDEWLEKDVGGIKVQIFEEAFAAATGREHGLCIFRKTCGDIPVVEHNGDFFSCDHFVDPAHCLGNILDRPLDELIGSPAQRAFGHAKAESLPRLCRSCEFLDMCNGGCPKDRFLRTSEGEEGLNYLCEGYRHFFAHCRPFIAELAALSSSPSLEVQPPPTPDHNAPVSAKPRRNDPCPCGSGKKYKKCCMNK